MKYLKLTSSKINHLYVVKHYSEKGRLVKTEEIRLRDLDKRCPKKTKLRVNGFVWGINTPSGSILPVGLPKFLRSAG